MEYKKNKVRKFFEHVLVKYSIFVNGIDESNKMLNNKTPLTYAVNNNNKELLKYLLENGADIEVKDKKGKDALYYANKNNNEEIKKTIMKGKWKVNEEEEIKETKKSEKINKNKFILLGRNEILANYSYLDGKEIRRM